MKYTCNECQHEFDGNDFTTECEACHSPKIRVSKMSSDIPWRKIFFGVFVLIALIFSLRTCSKTDDEGGGVTLVKNLFIRQFLRKAKINGKLNVKRNAIMGQ